MVLHIQKQVNLVECIYIGKQPVQDYIQLDVNSMYPFIMKENYYPVKLQGHIQKHNINHLFTLLKTHCVIARVLINTNKPVYPKIINKKCCFPTGEFYVTLNTRALQYAIKNGHIKDVTAGVYYSQAKIFKSYIHYLYNERLKAQAEGNRPFELVIKYLMNALYGKFAERHDIIIDSKYTDSNEFTIERWYNNVTKEYGITRVLFHQEQTLKDKQDSPNTFTGISAHITEDARMYMWNFIELCGMENVYYCDTDSLIVSRNTYNKYFKEYTGIKLGQLKIEKESSHLLIHTLKDYELGKKIVRKGITKGIVPDKDGVYEVLTSFSFKTMMELKILDSAILTKVPKILKRNYTKGQVLPSGQVRPYHLQYVPDEYDFQVHKI